MCNYDVQQILVTMTNENSYKQRKSYKSQYVHK